MRLHQRNQFAGNERKGDKHRGQHNARHREHDLDVMLGQPRPQPPLRAEHQHVNEARDHRRHRERQVDQREQNLLATKFKFRNRPGSSDAEHEIERHRDRRHGERELDRGRGIGLGERGPIGIQPLLESFMKHRGQRHE